MQHNTALQPTAYCGAVFSSGGFDKHQSSPRRTAGYPAPAELGR
ncbi:MAG: hypothetical protein AB2693_01035 [Candidatus Thiodiazotropha sp.]